MRVASLGGAAGGLLVQHEGCNILLDLPALPALSHAVDQHGSHHRNLVLRLPVATTATHTAAVLADVHAILITNPWALLGLPHLQAQLQLQYGRDLPIHTYCTEPCLHFFQQMSQELLDAQQALQQQQQQQQHQQPHGLLAAPVLHQMDVLHQQVQQVLLQQQPPPHQQLQQPAYNLSAGTAAPAAAADAKATTTASADVPLFSPKQLQAVLDAVQIVRFGQRLVLPGCFGMTAEARPSGSGIGSCLWHLSCGDQRYTYLSPAASVLRPGGAGGPFSAHLHQPSLHNLDVLLLGPGCLAYEGEERATNTSLCGAAAAAVAQGQGAAAGGAPSALPSTPHHQPPRQQPAAQRSVPEMMLTVALHVAAGAVARDGCVLVPVVAGEGVVLQLLEHLPAALAAAAAPPAAASARLVYLSPSAADALATANSCCEYLEQRRQQQVLERGEAPFAFDQLVKSGQLQVLGPLAPFGGSNQTADAAAGVVGTAAGLASVTAAAAGQSAANDAMQIDSGSGAMPAPGVGGGPSSSTWEPVVQRVLEMGPCVAFVPLWSLAAGPGALLSKAWCSSPLNLLLLPEAGPLGASWLQQCCDNHLMPPACPHQQQQQQQPQQQWAWQVQYAPLVRPSAYANAAAGCSSRTPSVVAVAAGGASAGGSSNSSLVNHMLQQQLPQGDLTATELLGALSSSGVMQQQQQRRQCQVVACERDIQLLQAAVQQHGNRLWTAQRQLNFVPLPEPATASLTSSSKAEQHGTVDSSSNSTVPAQLRWCQLNLPAPLLQASVSAELADRLQLQRLRITKQQQGFPQGQSAAAGAAAGGGALTQQQEVQEVSVARVQALLTHRSGSWRLDALPSEPRPEAASAVLVQQQQQQLQAPQELLWGSINTKQLLADLQAAGLQAELVSQPDAAVVISVDQGAAQLRLMSANETEVECDSAAMRQCLLECLFKQLHRVA